jgi:hypothetical protein
MVEAAAPEREQGPVMHPKNRTRPTPYRPEMCEITLGYCILGATRANLAELFHVTPQTIENWEDEYPEFAAAIEEGTDNADLRVARSFFRRAIGYNVTTTRTEVQRIEKNGQVSTVSTTVTTEAHIPPDPVAARQLLALRQGWREPNRNIITAHDVLRFAEMARVEAARRGLDWQADPDNQAN